MKTTTSTTQKFTCSTCGKSFDKEASLRGHCNKTGHKFAVSPAPDAGLDAAIDAATEEVMTTEKKSKKGKKTTTCICGCGSTTGGSFAPGHDAKMKSLIIKNLKAGLAWGAGLNAAVVRHAEDKGWMDKIKITK